ncbi:hypothetical protein STEG23_024883 [Scotinomys teguina]
MQFSGLLADHSDLNPINPRVSTFKLQEDMLGVRRAEACVPFFEAYTTVVLGNKKIMNELITKFEPTDQERQALEKIQECYNEAGLLTKLTDGLVLFSQVISKPSKQPKRTPQRPNAKCKLFDFSEGPLYGDAFAKLFDDNDQLDFDNETELEEDCTKYYNEDSLTPQDSPPPPFLTMNGYSGEINWVITANH